MLQRAASNAYSWWWASHVRTKQSRWLEQNLQDLEEKVKETLEIIDNDGDSFAQRAEMYYRRRPELINFVEEAFRAYRALAERYDHLSKELQSANRTIATVFPERVQYAMDDDEENLPGTSSSPYDDPNKQDQDVAAVPKPSIPKVPDIPKKDFRSQSMLVSRKRPIKRTASTSAKAPAVPSSGLSKEEALEEIDKLHKEILALQTEKEFVQSLYKRKYEKYWEIECQITEIQKRVCDLQDEFGVGTVIEDDEARTLMVSTALNSCQQTLVKLQEKQEQAAEEARVERQRIEEAHKKLGTLKDEFLSKRADCIESNSPELQNIDQEINDEEQEGHDMELPWQKIEEQIDLNSKTSLTVTELADKIDELVNKVATLETSVSTQTAMVKRLRSETDELQAHIRSLEEDKESLVKSSDVMSKKLKELKEELRRLKNLNQSVEHQSNNLQKNFTEASCGLDNLSGKLNIVKQDEKVEDTELLQEAKAVPDAEPENKSVENSDKMVPSGEPVISEEVMAEEEEKKDEGILALNNSILVDDENQPDSSNDLGLMPQKPEEPMQQEKDGKQDSFEIVDGDIDVETRELEAEEEEDQPIWRKLFVKGLEDREKILLEEYTSVLHNFKSVRKKLREVENKNRDNIFELGMQIRELKSAIVSKDEVIQSLLQKLSNPQTSPYTTPECKYIQQESIPQTATSLNSGTVSSNMNQKSLSDLFSEQQFEPTETTKKSPSNLETTLAKKEENNFKVNLDNENNATSPVEEKFRSDIDGLLEENLEFWLRFSTSVHQIQKFHTSIQDLHAELMELKHKKQGGGGKHQTVKSDIRPIYRHLREIQTELSLWMEHNALLKEELQSRFSSLCNIQDEIPRMSTADSRADKAELLSQYKAAKFQGEVLNMKQENNKVSDELQAGLNRVKAMKVDVEKTVAQLDDELGISASKKYYITGARIPLRSFLFGVKLKKQKPSIFSCVNPALQKQYSDLAGLPT